MAEKITKLALASRFIVLIIQLLANLLITDHKADVFRSPPPTGNEIHQQTWLDVCVSRLLGGLSHWDAEYFLHIAENGYSYENTLAFFPLYPLAVSYAGQALHYISCDLLSIRNSMLLAAVVLNIWFFCMAANTLYALTQRIFNDAYKSWMAGLLFCFNPASIFFTAAYSEALYAWLSLRLMYECVSGLRFFRLTAALAMSIVSRSNGLINAGFVIYFLMRRALLKPAMRLWSCCQLIFSLFMALLPLTFFYFYAFQQFCRPEAGINHKEHIMAYARERNYILAGYRQPENSPWCDLSFPYPYSYIQSHYWQVGFLRYYEWKQLPNFALAFPILSFMFLHCLWCLRHTLRVLYPKCGNLLQLLKEYKSLPFVLHALFLSIFCTLFVHIQISTRLLCSASPCVYWFAADYFPRSWQHWRLRSKSGAIVAWFGSYMIVGSILFSNNLPWT